MENSIFAVLSGILICFGVLMIYTIVASIDYEEYTFEYTYTESVDGSDIQTVIQNCVAFNTTETDLKAVKQKFIEDHDEKGKLVVKRLCDKTFFETPIYKKLTYGLDANSVLQPQ